MVKIIQSNIEDRYAEIMETVEWLSKIDRGSRDIEGLTRTASYLKDKLQEIGFETTVHDDKEYGPTLVGRKKGLGKAKIMMFAHMDTVWPPGTCNERPFYVKDNFAYGPGVSDCTHGIISSLYSTQALDDINFQDYGELIVLFNPDEELYSPSSKKWIEMYAKEVDVAFCMEGPDFDHQYIIRRGGVVHYEIEVSGIKSHAGVRPEDGRNAIEELASKIVAVHNLKIPNAIPQVTLIKGGISEGVIPDQAWAHVDIRVDTMEAVDAVHQAMKEIEKETLIEGTTTVCRHKEGGCLPLINTNEIDKFCDLVNKTSAEIGIPLEAAFCGGGADAWISAQAGTPTLDGLTPMSYYCHTDEECLDLNSIVPRITLVAALLKQISSDDQYLKNK